MASHSPYLINFAGTLVLVEAPNVGEALKLATGNTVSACKVATGKEYAAFVRGGGKVIIHGETPVPLDRVMEEIRETPAAKAVEHAIEHAEDPDKLRDGRADEIAVDGPGKVVRKGSSGLTTSNG